MNLLTILFIFFLIGTCFGSFSTVLIERWHSKKGGILFGRSECPSCHHMLSWLELFPIFSYIFQNGKCKNCKKKISIFYPLAEIGMGALFATMAWIAYNFGYYPTDIMWWIFILWGFITGVYILYDIRYMEIPDEILVPGIYGTLLLIFIGTVGEDFQVLFDIGTYHTFHTYILDHISAAVILYTFLYVQILVPGGFFLLKRGMIKELTFLGISYFTLPFTILIDLLLNKENSEEDSLDIPTWVGGGDLRVALFIGLTLGTVHGVASFFFAYIIGSIVGIFILITTRKKGGKNNSQIPFGPFLGIGWIISLFFYDSIFSFLNI